MFALNVCAMASVALLNRRLLRYFEPYQILGIAVCLQTAAVIMLCLALVLPVPRWLVIPALMSVIGALGAIGPNVQASVMQFFRELGGSGLAGTGQYFAQSYGLEPRLLFAWLADLTEFAGGLCLVLGLLTRPAAVAVIFMMAYTVFAVHLPNGFFWPQGGYE
ncbi:MAG: DoxX family membrane protein [Gammaproteobacteria bacterium]